MFLYKNLFFSVSSILSIPIMLIGINGGYFWQSAGYVFKFTCFQSYRYQFILHCSRYKERLSDSHNLSYLSAVLRQICLKVCFLQISQNARAWGDNCFSYRSGILKTLIVAKQLGDHYTQEHRKVTIFADFQCLSKDLGANILGAIILL